MQQSRFVFLALALAAVDDDAAAEATTWMLVSPNNRALGRAARTFDTYAASREAVHQLRERFAGAQSTVAAVEATGQWVWRVDVAGVVTAVSSRSYLRARECHYNLDRFLHAVPDALVVPGTRTVRGGRLIAGETAVLPVPGAPGARRTPRPGVRRLHAPAPVEPPA
ncbi:hypothetical protein Dfulv_28725 [Dactylosporangium fulvum]|uniref:Uncharacterized protein n=1 Tax=Dactylosporangium fulvum TaxID=53359 RepID=A0ABY5VNB1_9ACTN|nr:hypothetical protein [Dactylosporangium fulvum]UWP79148.1 hypothetical protein Dfulv_28725 [Dactylosporangium fulvum]